MGRNDSLGAFEQAVLLAVMRLRNNAYGVTIRGDIAKTTNRDVAVGAVYTTLGRLEEKGFVSSRVGDPTPERGGRAKRYYKIEAPGVRALNSAREAIIRMSEGLVPLPGTA